MAPRTAGAGGVFIARAGLRPAPALLALGLLLGVAACDEAEQDRPLSYQPGVYLGQKDKPLDSQQVDALEKRLQLQAGGSPPAS